LKPEATMGWRCGQAHPRDLGFPLIRDAVLGGADAGDSLAADGLGQGDDGAPKPSSPDVTGTVFMGKVCAAAARREAPIRTCPAPP
jgi:hypothetical protein